MRTPASTGSADKAAGCIDRADLPQSQMPSLVEDRFIDAAADATAMAYDPVQGILATGFANGQVCLYAYNRTSARYSVSATSIVLLQFIPAKAVLAVIDDQGILRVFDTHMMRYCFSYTVPSPPTCASFIPGTSWLLVGTHSGRVYFVDLLKGRKSDFSIGCRIKPIAAVATVEPHPVETEKILIGYVSGTCVVCDIGKASVEEKDMVLGSYALDGHPEGLGCSPRLASAGWSPAGDMIVASYESGVFCIFNVGSGKDIAPVVARTIFHDDILPESKLYDRIGAEDVDPNTACLGQVRWCTSAVSGQTFLVLTSGPSIVEQKTIHIFRTPGDVSVSSDGATSIGNTKIKSSSDVSALERLELESSVISLCTMPAESPWRGSNDDVQALFVLAGCPASVQVLELSAELQLSASQLRLPGDMQWRKNAMASAICQARDEMDNGIHRLLNGTLVPLQSLLLRPPHSLTPNSGLEQQDHGAAARILQAICAADVNGTLSLWCTRGRAFSQCIGLGADLDRLSRLLGIRGKVRAIDWYASNGLIAVSMDSGESLFFVVTQDPSVPLAKQSTCCQEIRTLSAEYYENPPPTICDASDAHGADSGTDHLAQRGPRVQSTHIDALPSKRLSVNMRDRAASLNEGSFIRRSSKRLSASIGSVFRRGTVHHDRTRGSEALIPSLQKDSYGFSRQMPADAEAWGRRLLKTNKELTKAVYGLKLDAEEYRQVVFGSNRRGDEGSALRCERVDSGALACAEDSKGSLLKQPREEQPCVVAPFMMTRFFYREILDIAVGYDGAAAIVYKGGVVVVVDCISQEVVLADNVNQPPSEQHTAFDVFSGAGASKGSSDTLAMHQEITCASFVLMRPRSDTDGQQQSVQPNLKEFLLVGTSAGLVLQYPVEGEIDPPNVVASMDAFSPIIYLSAVDGAGDDNGLGFVVVGSSSAISVLSDKSHDEIAKHEACKVHPNTAFVAASVLELDSGWKGVAAIDTKATVTLLSLPDLAVVDSMPLGGARGKIKSASSIQIGRNGCIALLTSDGSLLQARICEKARASHLETAKAGLGRQQDDKARAGFFDPSLQPPAQPLRKGATSWLFGRSSNAAPDIDAFLGNSCRDLLRKGTDGELPSQAQSSVQASSSRGQYKEHAKGNGSGFQPRERDSRRAPGDNIDKGVFSDMKSKAERRGQELQQMQDSIDRAQIASENYLASIRAYNAKQEKKSKLFGLF